MNSRSPRRGTTLIEVAAAIAVAGSLGVLILESQVMRSRQSRAIGARELATAEAGNLMDQFTSLPWSELTQEKLAARQLSDDFRRALPGASLRVEVEPTTELPESWRISLQIDWSAPDGKSVRPLCLTAWVYRVEAETPSAEEQNQP